MTLVPLVQFVAAVALALCPWLAQAAEKRIDRYRDVKYAEPDGVPLRAEVYVPRGAGPFPGVVVIHGGAWCVGSRYQLGRAAGEMAAHGYTAVAIEYRLAPKHKFPAQLEDCRTAVRWMRENAGKYKIDPNRIAAFGYSAGGHLAALLGVSPDEAASGTGIASGTRRTGIASGTRQLLSGQVQAVVAGGAPCDLEALPADSDMLAYFLGGTRQAKRDMYRQASPKALITKAAPPMLLFHGEYDLVVPNASSRQMAVALKQAGVTHELFIVPRAGHVATCYNDAALAASIKFLDRHLKR